MSEDDTVGKLAGAVVMLTETVALLIGTLPNQQQELLVRKLDDVLIGMQEELALNPDADVSKGTLYLPGFIQGAELACLEIGSRIDPLDS